MLLALHGDLGQVHRHCVVHLIVLQIFSDHKCDKFRVSVFLDLASDGVLPLEARLLLRVCVGIAFDGLENLGTELSS